MKWNESGFRPPLCTYRLNWARRASWGWWDDWDDTVLQTQDSKHEPWRSETEHATSRSRRYPTILTFTRGWGRNIFLFLLNRRDQEPNPELVKGSGANHYPRAPAICPTIQPDVGLFKIRHGGIQAISPLSHLNSVFFLIFTHLKCNAMQCNAMQCNIMQYSQNTMQLKCNTMRCDAIRCDASNAMQAMQCNAMQCNAMQCNAMQCNAMQCNAMQCNAMQCNAMQMRCNANAMQSNAM